MLGCLGVHLLDYLHTVLTLFCVVFYLTGRLVEANRDRWMTDGIGVTADIIAHGVEMYPVEGDTN